ncbi:hypothetical protein QL285_053503 [Trifolium repens]|nr:hypothetical protein QL285_053503 [Trifolium repens]
MFIFYILTSYAVANEHDNHGIYYPDMNNTSGLGFDDSEKPLQEISIFAATNVAAKNAKLLQKVFFAAKKLLLHVAGISVVAKSFARTINVAAITSVLQQQLMSLT